MAMQNIGGSADDEFFRYKMPEVMTKVEGRGNGIKTVIPNIADVARALKCEPMYPTKYFACELGAVSQWDSERDVGIVNGKHDQPVIAKLLQDFIKKYVLCPNCNYPETKMKVKKGVILAQCSACGFYGELDNQHKLATYILKNPPGGSKDGKKKDKKDKKNKEERRKAKQEKQKQKEAERAEAEEDDSPEELDEEAKKAAEEAKEAARKQNEAEQAAQKKLEEEARVEKEARKAAKKAAKKAAEEEDGEIHFEITEEMRNMKVDENVEIDDPVQEMKDAIAAADGTAKDVLAKVLALQKEKSFNDEERLKYFMKATVVDEDILAVTKKYISIYPQIMEERSRLGQLKLIACIEERCEASDSNFPKLSNTFMMLYDKDILEEEVISEWHEKGISSIYSLVEDDVSTEARKSADKFVEWLQNAEEEESDEE